MSAEQWVGAAILALPFVGLFAYCVVAFGWREAFLIFGSTAAIMALLLLGSHLLTGGAS